MRSIALVNQKGGCGKTTTAVNLASCLADSGKKVLIIDFDPQSHASIGLGVDKEKLTYSTYDLLMDPSVRIRDMAYPINERLDIIPSNTALSAVELLLAQTPGKEKRLLDKVEECEPFYDYLFVDCPPSVGLLTFNALIACKEALVVLEPSYYALHGAVKVIETIKLVRDKLDMKKRVRLLMSLFDRRTRFSRKFLMDSEILFGPGMLKTTIRNTVRLKEAAELGVPVIQHAPSCGGALDYIALAEEVVRDELKMDIDDFDEVARVDRTRFSTGLEELMVSQPGPHLVDEGVLFSIMAPEAGRVELIGSFNSWDLERSIILTRNRNGVWHTTVNLEPGRYLYKYLVDGEWISDPANMNRDAENDDCIIEVPEKAIEFGLQKKPEPKQEALDPEEEKLKEQIRQLAEKVADHPVQEKSAVLEKSAVQEKSTILEKPAIQVKPTQVKPVQENPTEAVSSDSGSTAAMSTEAAATEATSPGAMSAEAKPIGEKPVENKPAQVNPLLSDKGTPPEKSVGWE